MAARQGLPEDLMEFGHRVPPRVGIALASASWLIFHAVAAQTLPLEAMSRSEGFATSTFHTFISFSAYFLQYAVPFCLLVGVLVSFIKSYKAKRLLEEAKKNPTAALAAMSWRDFERVVGEGFKSQGFEIRERGGAGPDGGVDLLLIKDRERYLVQCKHWKTWQVGVAVVRELYGVIAAEKAAGGYVITSGHFTPDAILFAESCHIELIDGTRLRAMFLCGPGESNQQSPDAVSAIPDCPDCGAAMHRKIAGRGPLKDQPFWSCTSYPKCRGKLHIGQPA